MGAPARAGAGRLGPAIRACRRSYMNPRGGDMNPRGGDMQARDLKYEPPRTHPVQEHRQARKRRRGAGAQWPLPARRSMAA